MTIHFFNGFTCNAHIPAHLRTGQTCLLVEREHGLILVDTGLGQEDYVHKTGIMRCFQLVTQVPLDPQEAAVHQIARLGFSPQDVKDIVLTHMHFDHCGGLPDFPHARVHVHAREYESFTGRLRRWTDFAYVRRHIAHEPDITLYEEQGETWFDWPAIRLPFEPELWLVPLFGHSYGHCGVAIWDESGWLFHVGDAGSVDLDDSLPEWLVRFVLGPHVPSLRQFRTAHSDIQITTGHMWSDFFQEQERFFES